MSGMLRHDSGSVISSLQNYGDSDEEDNDPNNRSASSLPFQQQPEASVERSMEAKSDSQSPGEQQADNGIIISAPSPTTELEKQTLPTDKDSDFEQSHKDSESMETEPVNEMDDNYENILSQGISPAELISDDEGDKSSKEHLKHIKKRVVAETTNDSPASQGSLPKPGRQAARLVSYGPDEDQDDSDTSSEEEEEASPENSPELVPDNSVLSRSVRNMSTDEIQIPPEPPGKCSAALQKKIEDSFERMRREDYDLNRIIQSKKHFRNPSIYEKLIDFCHIDEKGTNFPPELYDTSIWGKESNYDELDKAQRKDMERREKEKKEKTKIEFLTGTKKSSSSGDTGTTGPSDEKRRKTKWDAQPSATGMNIQVSKMMATQQNPGVVNLTASATGTKATVIPAVGSLSKKISSFTTSSSSSVTK